MSLVGIIESRMQKIMRKSKDGMKLSIGIKAMNRLLQKVKIGDRLLINDVFDYCKVLNADDMFIVAQYEKDKDIIYIRKSYDYNNPVYFKQDGEEIVITSLGYNYFVPDGKRMFELTADYKPKGEHPHYWVVAKNAKIAKRAFTRAYSWLKCYDIREMNNEEAEEILKYGMSRMVMFV